MMSPSASPRTDLRGIQMATHGQKRARAVDVLFWYEKMVHSDML